jgi:hypothetical protein
MVLGLEIQIMRFASRKRCPYGERAHQIGACGNHATVKSLAEVLVKLSYSPEKIWQSRLGAGKEQITGT